MARRFDWFSSREVRALLWLLPFLAVVSWLGWEIARSNGWAKARGEDEASYPSVKTDGNNKEFPFHGGLKASGLSVKADGNSYPHANPDGFSRQWEGNSSYMLPSALADGKQSPPTPTRALAQPFAFDPNTVEYHDLVRLGFTRGEALGIIKYRERGKIFEIPEDFAACYQVSEEIYRRLKPYIRIGEEFRLKPWAKARGEGEASYPSVKTDGNIIPEGFNHRGKENSADSLPSALADGSKSPSLNRALAQPIELNTADSAALISISGIGPKTLGRIIEYRRRLGGFARPEQLAEVAGVTEQNYERIAPQIFVDTLAIQKIDINFADAKLLGRHPYIQPEQLRKLLKLRQLKGGWNNTGQLVEDKIFTPSEAARVAPYLSFGPIPH